MNKSLIFIVWRCFSLLLLCSSCDVFKGAQGVANTLETATRNLKDMDPTGVRGQEAQHDELQKKYDALKAAIDNVSSGAFAIDLNTSELDIRTAGYAGHVAVTYSVVTPKYRKVGKTYLLDLSDEKIVADNIPLPQYEPPFKAELASSDYGGTIRFHLAPGVYLLDPDALKIKFNQVIAHAVNVVTPDRVENNIESNLTRYGIIFIKIKVTPISDSSFPWSYSGYIEVKKKQEPRTSFILKEFDMPFVTNKNYLRLSQSDSVMLKVAIQTSEKKEVAANGKKSSTKKDK